MVSFLYLENYANSHFKEYWLISPFVVLSKRTLDLKIIISAQNFLPRKHKGNEVNEKKTISTNVTRLYFPSILFGYIK